MTDKEKFDDALSLICKGYLKLPSPQKEYKFTAYRKYRFDYAWPAYHIAIEYHGGSNTKGGHNSITGLQRDYEKLNHAQAIGWIVIQLSPAMARDVGYVESVLLRALQERDVL